MAIKLKCSRKSGRDVLSLKNLVVGYEDKVLMRDVSFELERGMKLAVIGANGLGKSTLLKTLVADVPKLGGSINFGHGVEWSYFAQDQLDTLDLSKTILVNLLEKSPHLGEQEARRILGGLLFRGQEVFKPVEVLSGGEKSRVGLAVALARQANLLFLDEPTNHLDMLSVEILCAGLCEYEGSAVFVSHDRDFINTVCTHTLVLTADAQCRIFEGDLDDYVRLSALCGFPNIFADPDSKAEEKKRQNVKKTKAAPNPKSSKKLEAEMEEMRAKIAHLSSQIESTAPTDATSLADLYATLEEQQHELTKIEELWLSENT